MNIIVKNIRWLMLFSGVITCTTFYAVIAPQDALLSLFGSNLTEPLDHLVVRSWGFLVSVMGALLIYGAFNEDSRMLCAVTTGISKIGFLFLILIFGADYIDTLWVTVVFDSIVVSILASYVVSSKRVVE
ncbi:MAG: hypothetical protein HN609_08425 [Proteobacteria bacterium]|jgi:hypothetical protein|nr:hypothetical protein [Pseudomonadota bacterium]